MIWGARARLPRGQGGLVADLRRIVGDDAVICRSAGITTYESDGMGSAAGDPLAVVLPRTTEQVSCLLKLARSAGVRVMPRGAGTSRCGGAIPLADSLVVSTSRMRAITAFDALLGHVRAQPGVTNQAISEHVRAAGWFYAPDPSSRRTCTIGGNIATNSSGACALRHGVTAHHLLGLTAVLHDGEVVELDRSAAGCDLVGFLCGSEGQLAVVAEASLRLEPVAERRASAAAGFASEDEALACASDLLHAGMVPYRLEFFDRRAALLMERQTPSGYALDAAGSLLVELHGLHGEVEADMDAVLAVARRHGATSLRRCDDEAAQQALWSGRDAIYRAVSRAGRFECLDCCVPRSRMGAALAAVEAIAASHRLEHAAVVHAGDGTLHAFLIHAPADADRARRCGDAIRAACVGLGGSISAEYGVGLGRRELLGLQYSALDLDQQRRARAAFAPGDRLNPEKVFPRLGDGWGERTMAA